MPDSGGTISVNLMIVFCYSGHLPEYCVLINQVKFNLHGPHGVLNHLKYLLERKGSAVVCVAEGAGQVSQMMILFNLDKTYSRSPEKTTPISRN